MSIAGFGTGVGVQGSRPRHSGHRGTWFVGAHTCDKGEAKKHDARQIIVASRVEESLLNDGRYNRRKRGKKLRHVPASWLMTAQQTRVSIHRIAVSFRILRVYLDKRSAQNTLPGERAERQETQKARTRLWMDAASGAGPDHCVDELPAPRVQAVCDGELSDQTA